MWPQTIRLLRAEGLPDTIDHMAMRIGLVVLWFSAAWVCGAMTAFVVGLPGWLAPVVAVAAAGYVGWWSGRREWRVRRSQPVAASLPRVAPAA